MTFIVFYYNKKYHYCPKNDFFLLQTGLLRYYLVVFVASILMRVKMLYARGESTLSRVRVLYPIAEIL